jgi:plastocyanin
MEVLMLALRMAAAALLPLSLSAPAAAQPAAAQTIYLWSYNYAPKPIHLRAGRPVTLTFVNRSGSGHDFTARRFFASSRILAGAAPGKVGVGPGRTRTVTLVPSRGTYPVHCSHFLHKQFGMQDLIVVD